MFHAKHADTKGPGNIIMWGNDADAFIILLKMFKSFYKVISGLMESLALITLASTLIYPDYLKNLIM